jgi:hypothetical protein
MLAALNELVEQRIADAMRKGEFESLPGAGRPLALDDDALVPRELRLAFRVLKNAGYVPPEVEAMRELNALLGSALAQENCDPHDRRASRRLLALTMSLEERGVSLSTQAALQYHAGLAARLSNKPRHDQQLGADE